MFLGTDTRASWHSDTLLSNGIGATNARGIRRLFLDDPLHAPMYAIQLNWYPTTSVEDYHKVLATNLPELELLSVRFSASSSLRRLLIAEKTAYKVYQRSALFTTASIAKQHPVLKKAV